MSCPHRIAIILILLALRHFAKINEGGGGGAAAAPACGNDLCNHEAVCQMEVNGQPLCQCIGKKYFQGPKCATPIDNCAPNPCQNGAPCVSAPGQAVCGPCTGDFAGQLCTLTNPNLFTRMFMHHNRYGYTTSEMRFLLTLENLGKSAFLIEINADNYAIDIINTDPETNGKKWLRSTDLYATARELGLRHAELLPYRRGYYYVSSGRFWKSGSYTIWIKISDPRELTPYFEADYKVEIIQKEDHCIPEIELSQCQDPFQPFMIDIARYQNFEPIIRRRCSETSSLRFEWNVYDSVESVLLHSYGQTNKPRLKIPPYASWYTFQGDVIQVAMIHVGMTEMIGKKYLYTAFRCYVMMHMKNVEAKIIGGTEREVNPESSVWLDGKESRDHNYRSHSLKHLIFKWTCISQDDPENAYCKKLGASGKAVYIPAGKLQKGKSYTIRLTVTSRSNDDHYDTAEQLLKMTANTPPLWLDIDCVRNCIHLQFTSGKMVHLRVHCLNCLSFNTPKYTWLVNQAPAGTNNPRLIIEKAPATPELTAHVVVKTPFSESSATITLKKNEPPRGGDCKIEPANGIEYETLFSITCQNFEDEDIPLLYEYKVHKFFTLQRNAAAKLPVTRLPETQEVIVNVCDSLGACTEFKIAVSVTPLQVSENIAQFLENKKTNLRNLIERNDLTSAMVLALKLTKSLKSLQDAQLVIDSMSGLDVHMNVGLEQLLEVVASFYEYFQPLKHDGAGLLAILLKHTAHAYRNILLDDEVIEMELETFRHQSDILAELLNALVEKAEQFPAPQTIRHDQVNVYDRITENYDTWIDFDPDVLLRLNNWLQFNTELNSNLNLLGFVAAHVYRPTEPRTLIDKPDVQLEAYEFEKVKKFNIITADGTAEIVLSAAVVTDIKAKRQSASILRQIASTTKNPFWWYPQQFEPVTGVLYFTAFDSKFTASTTSRTKLDHRVEFRLQLVDPSAQLYGAPALGRIMNYSDMNVFRFRLPTDALLVIEFLSTDVNIRIMLALDGVPTGRLTRTSSRMIKTDDLTDIAMLLNTQRRPTYAYLSIVAAVNMSKPAYYSFSSVLRSCVSWSLATRDPEWSTAGCQPQFEAIITDYLVCYCEHLSIYAGQIQPITSYALNSLGDILDEIPINLNQILYVIITGLLMAFWIIFAFLMLDANRERLVTAPKDPGAILQDHEDDEIVLHITTGGYRNASTTAGIMITIQTLNGGEQKFKIYQNPQRPHLSRNSTCTLRLPLSPRYLLKPISITLRQDGGGRYPTWYCQSVELNYVGAPKSAMLKVNRWITAHPVQIIEGVELDSDPSIEKLPQGKKGKNQIQTEFELYPAVETPVSPIRKKLREFGISLETIFVNWFLFQPLLGPWKYGNQTCNRFERTVLWLIKFALSLLIVTFYFGWTTLDNYEGERRLYRRVGTYAIQLLIVSMICFFVGSLIQLMVELWMLRTTKKDYRIVV